MKKKETPPAEKIVLFTIPNLLTLCNLLCGSLAVVFALHYNGGLQMAFFMILLAAVFDFLDGFAARLLGGYSRLGIQLDSLSDVISFGLAPSAILLNIYESVGGEGEIGYAVFLLAAFSALRLAKFNIDERQRDGFLGLPTPAAALLVASAGYLFDAGSYAFHPGWVFAVVAALCALLVSNIPMFALKFKHYGLRGNELRYGFLLLSAVLLALMGWGGLAPVILLYIVISVVAGLVCRSGSPAKGV